MPATLNSNDDLIAALRRAAGAHGGHEKEIGHSEQIGRSGRAGIGVGT